MRHAAIDRRLSSGNVPFSRTFSESNKDFALPSSSWSAVTATTVDTYQERLFDEAAVRDGSACRVLPILWTQVRCALHLSPTSTWAAHRDHTAFYTDHNDDVVDRCTSTLGLSNHAQTQTGCSVSLSWRWVPYGQRTGTCITPLAPTQLLLAVPVGRSLKLLAPSCSWMQTPSNSWPRCIRGNTRTELTWLPAQPPGPLPQLSPTVQ